MSDTVDLVIVGGGTAGIVAAKTAAGFGARVVLVERHRTGGDCLWTGCVPGKSLIAAARAAHAMRSGARFGIQPVEPKIDFGAVMAHVHAAIARIEPDDSRVRSPRPESSSCTARPCSPQATRCASTGGQCHSGTHW